MLDHSREFIKLAIYENMTTAAHKLHLAPSTLSRHLADLENELGFRLFNRNPLALTPAGQFYLESISSLIESLDEIVLQGRAISNDEREPFSIYMLPARTAWNDMIYEAASALRKLHPGTTTKVCIDDKYLTTEEALANGAADIGVVFEGSLEDERNLTVEKFAEAPLCAWVTPDNPLAGKTSVTFANLGRFAIPCSTNQQSKTGTNSVEWFFRAHGIVPRTHFRNLEDRAAFYTSLRSDEVMVDFAEDRDPWRFNSDLVRLDFSEIQNAPIYLAYRTDDTSPLVRDFLAACRSIAAGDPHN